MDDQAAPLGETARAPSPRVVTRSIAEIACGSPIATDPPPFGPAVKRGTNCRRNGTRTWRTLAAGSVFLVCLRGFTEAPYGLWSRACVIFRSTRCSSVSCPRLPALAALAGPPIKCRASASSPPEQEAAVAHEARYRSLRAVAAGVGISRQLAYLIVKRTHPEFVEST